MKQLVLLLALLTACVRPAATYAQATDSLSLRLDQVFANVDKNQVPTSRLLGAAVPV